MFPRKTILAALLFCLLAFPSTLFVVFQLQQIITRYEMEEKLEKPHLVTIRVPVNSVKWHKKNKEIIVDGKLFDVKSYVIEKSIAEFTGLFDDKETEIKKRIENLADREKDGNSQKAVIKFTVHQFFYNDKGEWTLPEASPLPVHEYCSLSTDNILSTEISSPSPPPKV